MTSLTDKQIKAAESEWLDLWKQGPSRNLSGKMKHKAN